MTVYCVKRGRTSRNETTKGQTLQLEVLPAQQPAKLVVDGAIGGPSYKTLARLSSHYACAARMR